jgi:hypothetical protein
MKVAGIEFQEWNDLEGFFIPRENLLDIDKYDLVKVHIAELKKNFSSSFMTSLQKNATNNQKWPLLNLVRQILNIHHYKMVPVRKSDGYTPEGTKKFKRFFRIVLSKNKNQNPHWLDEKEGEGKGGEGEEEGGKEEEGGEEVGVEGEGQQNKKDKQNISI